MHAAAADPVAARTASGTVWRHNTSSAVALTTDMTATTTKSEAPRSSVTHPGRIGNTNTPAAVSIHSWAPAKAAAARAVVATVNIRHDPDPRAPGLLPRNTTAAGAANPIMGILASRRETRTPANKSPGSTKPAKVASGRVTHHARPANTTNTTPTGRTRVATATATSNGHAAAHSPASREVARRSRAGVRDRLGIVPGS